MDLANRGFIVVNFTYHLAPKYKFPASIEDTNAVFDWVMKNAGEYGFDTDNIFAVGDSAGAQMLSIYSAILTNPQYASRFAFKTPEALKLKGIALNCGLYDIENTKNISFLKDLLKNTGNKEELNILSPAKFVTASYPPSYVMTANFDELKEQAPFIVKALEKNSVKHVFKEYGTDDNKLYHVFHCNIKTAEAAQANKDECDFFRGLMN